MYYNTYMCISKCDIVTLDMDLVHKQNIQDIFHSLMTITVKKPSKGI